MTRLDCEQCDDNNSCCRPTNMSSTTNNNTIGKEIYIRGAVALNNTAVSLLEQGCHEQAIATIRDALFVLKTAAKLDLGGVGIPGITPPPPSPPPLSSSTTGTSSASSSSSSPTVETDPLTSMDFDGIMQRAACRHANPRRCCTSAETSSCSSSKTRLISRQRVSTLTVSDDADISETEAALRVRPREENVIFPIRFDSIHDFQELRGDEARLIGTIILHNYALACLCRARTVPDATMARRLFMGSYKIFVLCHKVLFALSQSHKNDRPKLKQLFFVSYVILSMLVLCLHQLSGGSSANAIQGNPQGSAELAMYQTKLERLKAGVQELNRAEPFISLWKKMAAAA